MSESANKVRRRRTLNRKAVSSIIKEARFLEVQEYMKVEEAEIDDGPTVYLLDEEIQLFRFDGLLYPTLRCRCVDSLPAVKVDMGAIPYICKGADVMAPGIKEIEGDFDEDATVVVRDVKYGKALSIGRALRSASSILAEKKGKVIKNLHYVGDKIWSAHI